MNRGKGKSGFTLIEIMVVIVIIMILMGIVIGAAKYAHTKGATSRAQAEIAMMENALESYKNDNGTYPLTPAVRPTSIVISPNGNSPVLYTALASGPGYPKTYMTFKLNQISVPSVNVTNIVDPFGVRYNYYCTQPVQGDQTNSVSFDLWSYGPDNLNDTADDITNWKQ